MRMNLFINTGPKMSKDLRPEKFHELKALQVRTAKKKRKKSSDIVYSL